MNYMLSKTTNLEQATALIITRAKQLVNQLIEDRGHDKPPFLPEEFARLQGIKIVKADLGETSAVLLRFNDGPVIKVNQTHPPVRQNFSCAHEIGHNLLRELKIELNTENIEFRTFNPQGLTRARVIARERICDTAATELLMPEFVFRKYLLGFGVSVHSIARLANVFRVSNQATAIRIAEVSPEPCAVLMWREHKKRSKSLRLAWSVGPRGKLGSKTNYTPRHATVERTSTLYKAHQYDNVVNSWKLFKIDNAVKRLPMESKGFSSGETRYVISLAFIDR